MAVHRFGFIVKGAGFGPIWTARVIDAIDGAIPVGPVSYGPESIDQVHALFAS